MPNAASKKSRRVSGFFTLSSAQPHKTSPPTHHQPLHPDSHTHDALAAQIEALTKERDAAKAELEKTRHDLTEAQDAREASEHCVNALRQFISANAIGESEGGHARSGSNGIKLPPLPSDTNSNTEEIEERKSLSSWTLKLWRVDTGASTASRSSANESMTSIGSTDHARKGSTDSTPQTATPPVPLSRKLGSRTDCTTRLLALNARALNKSTDCNTIYLQQRQNEQACGKFSGIAGQINLASASSSI